MTDKKPTVPIIFSSNGELTTRTRYRHEITHLLPFFTAAIYEAEQDDHEPHDPLGPVMICVRVQTPSSSLRLAAFWPDDIDPEKLSRHISALEIEESRDGLIFALNTLVIWLDKQKPASICGILEPRKWSVEWQEVMNAWTHANAVPWHTSDELAATIAAERREHRAALVRLTSKLPT